MARHKKKAEKEAETVTVLRKDLYDVLYLGEWIKEHADACKRLEKLVPMKEGSLG